MTDGADPHGMVGRQGELAELERQLAVVRGGRPLFTVVEGPAGIGKTLLVEHFLAHQGDARLHRVSGASWESARRFGVVEQLGQACGTDLPSISRPGTTRSTPSPVDPGADLLALWAREQEHDPVVVVVDDAHWSDIESLQALDSAFRRMLSERALILLLAREEPQTGSPEEVHDFLTTHRGPRMRVGPLTPDDVQSLAVKWAKVDLNAPAAQQLTEHTGGNPLHTRQLLEELPAETWREWQPTLPAPRRVASTVARSLSSCSAPVRVLVEAAAVLGRTVSFTDAAKLAALENPVHALDGAGKAGLLRTGGGRGVTTLTFPSPLIRAAIYTGLQPLARQQLHQAAAELVDSEGERLQHRVAAAAFADADLAEELDEFASRQAALGMWSAAGEALISASRLSPVRADREHRLIRAVDALVGAGDLPQALAFAPAVESFPAGPLRNAVLGYLAIQLGRPGEAELLLDEAWQQCDQRRAPGTAALICQRRVLHSLSRWHGSDLVNWVRRAVELAADPREPSAVESEAILGLGLAAIGQSRQARQAYHEVTAKVDVGAQLQRVQMGKGWLDLALDDPHNARRELEGAAPTEYRRGSARISLWAQGWLARTEFALGDWDEALRTVDRAVAHLEHVGLELARPLVHWTGAQAHALRGDWDVANEHLQQVAVTPHAYEIMLVPACLARAQCAEARADYETVLRCLEPLVQVRNRQGIDEPGFWPWHDIYANALVMTSRAAEADTFLAPHEVLAAERGHRSTRARLGYVRGRVHGAFGDIDAAKESFDDALSQLAGLPLPYDRARVNFAYGQTLRRAGKRREADSVLRNAREAYTALGARAYVERCDRELKAGGFRARRTGPGLAHLTAQEQAVARLVAAGMSNKQAAVELFVSVKTVQYHLTRIYGKLGVRSRGELAARFHEELGEENS